jgi:hypothetical protein
MGKVKDVVGEIKKVGEISSREFIIKNGPNAGKPFTTWSQGICLDDGAWYNIKSPKKEKVEEVLINSDTKANFKVGDNVKIYLESEDEEGKYWKIAAIAIQAGAAPKQAASSAPPEIQEELVEDTPKQTAPAGPVEPKRATPEERAQMLKEGKKDMGTVAWYNEQEKNKYIFGMACNNAALIFAALIDPKEDIEVNKSFIKANGQLYEDLVRSLYKKTQILRKELVEDAQNPSI